jgi:hypothetical protein
MRRELKFALFFGLLFSITFLSNDNGRTTGTTGAPGEPDSITCEACHIRGNFDPIMEIELRLSNIKVTTIKPATTYTLNVKLGDRTGKARAYGFQLVPLTSRNTMAGSFPTLGSKVKRANTLNRSYLTHSSPNTTPLFTATWTSPANLALEDSIVFYYAGISGDNVNESIGDNSIAGKTRFVYTLSSSSKIFNTENIKIWPTVSSSYLYLSIADFDQVKANIYDLYGRLISENTLESTTIDVSDLNQGLYYLSLRRKGIPIFSSSFTKL